MAVPVVTWEQYAADWSGLHGGVDLAKVRPGVRRWLWFGFVLARSLHRVRVPAGAVTALGLLSSVTVIVVVTHGSGGILLAALLVFVATLADSVDGALAVLSGHTTRLGYVYDAVVDRIGEACWLIAFWRIGAAGHIVVAAGALAWLHEYVRSRGNAAGMTEITAVTVGERPTRVMLTIGGLVLAGFAESFNPRIAAGIAAIATAAWIVLGLIGIAQLLAAVHRALAGRRWPTWRPPGTSNATTPSVPPAPIPPFAGAPAMPTGSSPIGAADRPGDLSYGRGGDAADEHAWSGGTSVGPVSGSRAASADARDDGDGGISEVVSYAAPSADEPSEASDLALSEPTLDDLLGDAGVRVRSAVEKHGRSVTVYRSQAAGTTEVDLANADDGSDAPLPIDVANATDGSDAQPRGDVAAGADPASDIEGRSASDVGPEGDAGHDDAAGRDSAGGSDGPGVGRGLGGRGPGAGGHAGHRGPSGAPGGRDGPVGNGGADGPGDASGPDALDGPGGLAGRLGGDQAAEPELAPRSAARAGEGSAGRHGGSRTAARNPARIRFGRRSRRGASKPAVDDAGRSPGQGAAQGSDRGGGT